MPIFTIGAAQAGLYSAVKVLQDKEDDSSPAKAFFKGFKSGFGTVTLAWGIMTVILLLIGYLGIAAIMQGSMKWLVAISVSICGIFQCLIPLFHSRFNCTASQLFPRSCCPGAFILRQAFASLTFCTASNSRGRPGIP